MSVLSPNERTSPRVLRVHIAVWLVLLALWISRQFWGTDTPTFRALMAALALVSAVQALNAFALLRRKRQDPSGR
jgi:hypothetical protein